MGMAEQGLIEFQTEAGQLTVRASDICYIEKFEDGMVRVAMGDDGSEPLKILDDYAEVVAQWRRALPFWMQ